MQRLIVHLTVALLTFCIGVIAWFTNPVRWIQSSATEPLQVTISSTKEAANAKVPFDHFVVTIKNVSKKTVRGYSLGFTCDCFRSADDPYGINFTNPNPDRQVLKPGESQTMPLDSLPSQEWQRMVWADLVHFKNGTNWGPNQSHTEGYVRE